MPERGPSVRRTAVLTLIRDGVGRRTNLRAAFRPSRRLATGGWPCFEILWSDVRYAVRLAARTPAVSLAVALAVALGVGGTTGDRQRHGEAVPEAAAVRRARRAGPARRVAGRLGVVPEVNALDARDWTAAPADAGHRHLRRRGRDAASRRRSTRIGDRADRRCHTRRGSSVSGPRSAAHSWRRLRAGATPAVVLGQRFWRESVRRGPGRRRAHRRPRHRARRDRRSMAGRRGSLPGWRRRPLGPTHLPRRFLPQPAWLDRVVGRRAPQAWRHARRRDRGDLDDRRRLAVAYPDTNTGRTAIVEPLQAAMVGPVQPMVS